MRREGWVVVGGKDYEARWSGFVREVEEIRDFGAGTQKGEVGRRIDMRVNINDWIGCHPGKYGTPESKYVMSIS